MIMFKFLSSSGTHNAIQQYCPEFIYNIIKETGLWDGLHNAEEGYLQKLYDFISEYPLPSIAFVSGAFYGGYYAVTSSSVEKKFNAQNADTKISDVVFEKKLETVNTFKEADAYRFIHDTQKQSKIYHDLKKQIVTTIQQVEEQSEQYVQQIEKIKTNQFNDKELNQLYTEYFDDLPDHGQSIENTKEILLTELYGLQEENQEMLNSHQKFLNFVNYKSNIIESITFNIQKCPQTGNLVLPRAILSSPSFAQFVLSIASKGSNTDYSALYPMLFSPYFSEKFVNEILNAASDDDFEAINTTEQLNKIILEQNTKLNIQVSDDQVILPVAYGYLFAKYLDANQAQAKRGTQWDTFAIGQLINQSWDPTNFCGEKLHGYQNSMQMTKNSSDHFKLLTKQKTGLQNDLIVCESGNGHLDDMICVGPIAGEGGFGTVCIGRSLTTGEFIAVKLITNADNEDEEERSILETLKEHRGAFRTEDNTLVIMSKFHMGTDLLDHLKHDLSLENRLELAIKACESIQNMHENGLIHLDVKPENFIANITDNDVKVTRIDFGTSLKISDETPEILERHDCGLNAKGTKGKWAPEVAGTHCYDNRAMHPNRIYSKAADVYSLGVMLKEDLNLDLAVIKDMLIEKHEDRVSLVEVIKQLKAEYLKCESQKSNRRKASF